MATLETDILNKYIAAKNEAARMQNFYLLQTAAVKGFARYQSQSIETQKSFKQLEGCKTDEEAIKRWDEAIPHTRRLRSMKAESCRRAKYAARDAQRKMAKAYEELTHYYEKRPVWFVASVRDHDEIIPKIEGKEELAGTVYHNHDSRCWGFFYDLETAMEAIRNNVTDLNEAGYYAYAVIEPKKQGLCYVEPSCSNRWFKAKYGTDKDGNKICTGYVDCEEPEWAKQIVGWTIS
jgi:hypothetical protein